VLAASVVALAALAAGAWAATPRAHSAPGCFWWTAQSVGEAVAGSHGCLRGYVRVGGALAEGRGVADYGLSFDSGQHACGFRAGDAVVVRYHAVFDDGRLLLIVDDCR
jgi:hypothetical protein